MVFSYNWLKEYIKLPKPEKLAELLTMHAFEVEEIKKAGKPPHHNKGKRRGAKKTESALVWREGKDYVLDIDVLPNRGPDCFSHIGIARECAAFTNSRLQIPKFKLKEDKNLKTKDFVTVEVKNKNDCLRYTARVIANVKVGPSPKWIQERLKVCGLRPINNIVDATNYVMLETGQPLHAFDLDKISNKKIIVRRAKNREKIITLDNKRYNLDKDILAIADVKSPLAVAGIKGGKKAEIDKKTKTIVLESANFDSRIVRKGSKKLGLKTDASWRFEHRIDSSLTETGINRAAEIIQNIAKGKITSGLVDFYPKKVLPKKIKLDYRYLTKLLGLKIEKKDVKQILKRLGFKIIKEEHPILIVEIPTFRLDISLPEDLIEEIGRIYGFQRIPAAFPIVSLIPPKRNFEIFWEDITKNILKESGFTEVYNYSFIGEKESEVFKGAVEVENPMSVEQKYLRPSLIPNLLKNVIDNFRYFNEIKIFELGKIFIKKQDYNPPTASSRAKGAGPSRNKKQIEEKRMLAGLITGDAFYQAKGVVDSLLNKLGISNVWYDEYKPTPEQSKISIWHKERCAEIKVDGQEIGFLGEISSGIFKKTKVVIFDIDFEKLIKLCSEEHEYQPISQYPAAIRDLAVLVPLDVKVVDVLNKINVAGGALVRDVDLFDIYEGEGIVQGKKNLAFHIIYQAEDRTLKSKEIDKIHQKIIKILEENPEWEVRK